MSNGESKLKWMKKLFLIINVTVKRAILWYFELVISHGNCAAVYLKRLKNKITIGSNWKVWPVGGARYICTHWRYWIQQCNCGYVCVSSAGQYFPTWQLSAARKFPVVWLIVHSGGRRRKKERKRETLARAKSHVEESEFNPRDRVVWSGGVKRFNRSVNFIRLDWKFWEGSLRVKLIYSDAESEDRGNKGVGLKNRGMKYYQQKVAPCSPVY